MPRRDRPTIEEILDRGMLRRMADAGSFERGEDYVEGGQVRSFVVHEGASAAVFSFLSGLYFRGKLAYAQAFASPPPTLPGVHVITPTDGLRLAEPPVDLARRRRFARVDIQADDARYHRPLMRDAQRLAAAIGPSARSAPFDNVAL